MRCRYIPRAEPPWPPARTCRAKASCGSWQSIQVEGGHQANGQRVGGRVIDVFAAVETAVGGAAAGGGREPARAAGEPRWHRRSGGGFGAQAARGRELRGPVLLVEQVLDAEREVEPAHAVPDLQVDLGE